MAEKIATYTAKELALRPSNAGYEAAQQAGRRLGPLAETAARAIRDVADLSAKVTTELGAQQTAFLRFEGLEAKEDRGGGVKYGGGLKDMFQLGAGGNEPNYAKLNRLSELQDGPLAIAAAARHMVNAQSPLTHGLSPQQAWERQVNGEGLTDQERQLLNASGLGKKEQAYENTGYSQGYGGKDEFDKNPNGDLSPEGLSKEAAQDALSGGADSYLSNTYGIHSDASGGSMTGNAPAETSTGGYGGNGTGSGFGDVMTGIGHAINPFGPAISSQDLQALGTWGGLLSDPSSPTPAPTASSTYPTTSAQPSPDAPTTPADGGAATSGFWGMLNQGMSPEDNPGGI